MARHIKKLYRQVVSDKRLKALAKEAGVVLTDALMAQVDRSSEAAVVKSLAKLAGAAAKKALTKDDVTDPMEPRP